MLVDIERLISEINQIHQEYAQAYFETSLVEKVNLGLTFSKVSTSAILAYRLNLHESIYFKLKLSQALSLNLFLDSVVRRSTCLVCQIPLFKI